MADITKGVAGNISVGSYKFKEGIRLYNSSFRGNQYMSVFNVGKLATSVSRGTLITSFGVDTIRYASGDITGKHYAANTIMNGVGQAGPPGLAAASIYWGVDTFYPGESPQAFWDLAAGLDNIILNN